AGDEAHIVVAGQVEVEAAVESERPRQRHAPPDLSRCRLLDAADELDEGRLAGAVAAEDRELLAHPDRRVDAVEHPARSGVGRVLLDHVVELDHSIAIRLRTARTMTRPRNVSTMHTAVR